MGHENKWISKNKGRVGHGKIKGPMMSKHRGICHSVRERMVKHNKEKSCDKERDIHLTNNLETGFD